jgi:hypothetical protein
MANYIVCLIEARNGRPTESKAVSYIATTTIIPTSLVALLLATQLVEQRAPFGQLVLVCGIAALVAAILVLIGIYFIYKRFGFRPVVWLADSLFGGIVGISLAAILGSLFADWWPILLIPICAIAWPILAPLPNRSDVRCENRVKEPEPIGEGKERQNW